MDISYVLSNNFISLVVDNKPYNISSSHMNFELIKQKLKDRDYEDIINLVSIVESISKSLENTGLEIIDDEIYYNGEILHSSLVNQIIETKKQGYEYDNLLKFLENLMNNTIESVRNELYDWISSSNTISITNDGAFLAYKKVRSDYKDIFTGTFDNSVGNVLEINTVDSNRTNVCSYGLHFCSFDYLSEYGSNDYHNSRVIIVKIFPQDVVSIPIDYKFQKGRCKRYEVVGECFDWNEKETLTKPVDDYDFNNWIAANFESLTTTQMTAIYNSYYDKNIKHLRTKKEAIKQMLKIYNDIENGRKLIDLFVSRI